MIGHQADRDEVKRAFCPYHMNGFAQTGSAARAREDRAAIVRHDSEEKRSAIDEVSSV
jgi:hypothetical protein